MNTGGLFQHALIILSFILQFYSYKNKENKFFMTYQGLIIAVEFHLQLAESILDL
mgnify:CR=1 FL=1